MLDGEGGSKASTSSNVKQRTRHLISSDDFKPFPSFFFFTWSVPATSHAGDIDHAIDDVGQYIVRVRERESYTCMYMCMDAIDGLSSG